MVANEGRLLGIEILAEKWPENTIIGLGGAATVGREKEERKLEREGDLHLLGANET